MILVVERTNSSHAGAGLEIVIFEETADMSLRRVGDFDAEQVG